MGLTAEALRVMASKGLTIQDAIDIADAMSVDRSSAAERQARYREKRRERDVTRDVTPPSLKDAQTSSEPSEISQNPIPQENPPTGVKRSPKSRRCPADYEPSPAVLDLASDLGFSDAESAAELAELKDHQFRDAHVDWDAAFRNWLRTAAKRRPQARAPPLSFGMQDALVRQAGFNMALEEIDRRNGRAKRDHQSDQSVVVALPAPASVARRGG